MGNLFYSYQIGSLEEIGDDYIVVLSERGRTTITLDQDRSDSVLFNTDALDYFPNGVRLYKDNTGKEDVLKHLLSINETLKIFAGIEGREAGIEYKRTGLNPSIIICEYVILLKRSEPTFINDQIMTKIAFNLPCDPI